MEQTYSKETLNIMNCRYPWNGSIKHSDLKTNSINSINSINTNTYKLYATGDADVSLGRIYISLPTTLKITNDIKKKYNLM